MSGAVTRPRRERRATRSARRNSASGAASRARLGPRRVQRRRRQRLPGLRRRRRAGRPGAGRHRRQPQLSARAIASSRSSIAAPVRPPPRDHPHRPSWPTPDYRANPADRCYYCKQELFGQLTRARPRARDRRGRSTATTPTIAATTVRAAQAAREFGVRSPLDEADLGKRRDPRALARGRACRSGTSRRRRACRRGFRTTARSPTRSCGRSSAPRTRCTRSGSACAACATTTTWPASRSARDEMPRPLDPDVAAAIVRELKAAGYRYVSLDLQGYRTGSLNEALRCGRSEPGIRDPMRDSTTMDTTAPRGPWRWLAPTVAVVFLAAHLPFLAPTLEDLDSVNFALGVRRFDPTEHRPHPPGYPIYIALGKLSTAAFDWVSPSGARDATASARALEAADRLGPARTTVRAGWPSGAWSSARWRSSRCSACSGTSTATPGEPHRLPSCWRSRRRSSGSRRSGR